MGIIIRTAQDSDLEQYTKLLQTTYVDAYSNRDVGLTKECFSKNIFNSKDTQKYLKSHLINNDRQSTWLAFIDKKLVGAATCINIDQQSSELTGFYVHPKKQGIGIGKELYNLVLKFSGKRELLLDIYAHNIKTIEIYKSWGWKPDESKGDKGFFYRHWSGWPEGLRVRCMYMKLDQTKFMPTKKTD